MAYQWVGRKFGVDPNVVGKIFEQIEERDGIVTRIALLLEASEKDSPIHELFEWNDSEAAYKYRLMQAGDIIRHISVVITEDEDKPVRAFVNVNTDDGQQADGLYMNVKKAMQDEESRKIVLRRALHELKIFEKKYSMYKELEGVFLEIEKLEAVDGKKKNRDSEKV